MQSDLLSPLSFYKTQARAQHEKNVSDRFNELLARSGVDTAENAAVVSKYNIQLNKIKKLNGKISSYKILRVFMIIFAVLGLVLLAFGIFGNLVESWQKIIFIAIGTALVISMPLLIFLKINKLLRHFDSCLIKEREKPDALYRQAINQVTPLLLLFTDYDTQELIEKTLPDIKFDKSFCFERLDDLTEKYGFIDTLGDDISSVDTLSGTLGGNPFLFEKTKQMRIEMHTYHGYRTISWTTVERGSDGKMRTVHHTDTLHASVTKPKPEYYTSCKLHFGHSAAPKLNFSRVPEHSDDLSDRALRKKISKGEDKLEERERRELSDNDDTTNYTKLANGEFEVLFGATNRNNEQQFRLLYTPLAQTETVKLILDSEGYGDDFSFTKRGSHNIIESEHSQSFSPDSSTKNYFSHDVNEIKEKFISFNNNYFKSLFFDFAPLLAIPAYHAEQTPSIEKHINMHNQNYPTKEYEVLANRMKFEELSPTGCDTELILKARAVNRYGQVDNAEITAHGFRAEGRTHFEQVFGGDGRFHTVAVNWIEYIPISKSTFISLKYIGLPSDEFVERMGGENSFGVAYHGLYASLAEDMKTAEEKISRVLSKK